jgi:hypothetical protein
VTPAELGQAGPDPAERSSDDLAAALKPGEYYIRQVAVRSKGEKADGSPWTLYEVTVHTAEQFSTFSTSFADLADQALREARPVAIETKPEKTKRGFTLQKIVSIVLLAKLGEELPL